MRIIAAVRLSRLVDETTSVDSQTESLREYASRLGHVIAAETQDLDVSGGLPIRQRPDIGAWLTPDHLHEWDAIAGYSVDRMFRNLYDFVTFYHDFLEPNGKSLIVTSENIDMSTADGRTMAQMRVIFAENELNKIAERNARAAKALLEQGYWNGGPIRFGFMRQREGSHWILVPHPENAQIIREIAEGIIAGMPVSAAARELTTRQIPTGRKHKGVPLTNWHATTLISMLRNPALAGYITWQHKFTKGKDRTYKLVRGPDGKPLKREPAILDQETFDALQRVLRRPAQKRGRVLGTARLIRIAYCGECKQPLWSSKFMSKGKPYAYYKCSIQCGAKKIPLDALHAVVDEMVSSIGHRRNKTPKMVAGRNYERELEENKAQLQELDPDEPDYEADRKRLLDERARLKALPAEPDHVEIVEDNRTVAEVYADNERAWLLKHDWQIWAHKDGAGQLIVTGGGGELHSDMGISRQDLTG